MTMEHTKRLVQTETGKDGVEWGVYENINTVKAIQINEPFQVELERGGSIHGKSGDYFVYDGSSCWITDKTIFESTYSESEKKGEE